MSAIGLKNLNVLEDMLKVGWSPILIAVLKWMIVRYSKDHILITSAYREGDPGVHGINPLRGLDLRSTVFEDPEQVVEDINSHWKYDPSRPEMKVALLHDVGKGIHFHVQVHPNTIYKTKNVNL